MHVNDYGRAVRDTSNQTKDFTRENFVPALRSTLI